MTLIARLGFGKRGAAVCPRAGLEAGAGARAGGWWRRARSCEGRRDALGGEGRIGVGFGAKGEGGVLEDPGHTQGREQDWVGAAEFGEFCGVDLLDLADGEASGAAETLSPVGRGVRLQGFPGSPATHPGPLPCLCSSLRFPSHPVSLGTSDPGLLAASQTLGATE